jgi:1-acyl-sn-glycerol-3-phosphate acyltransferase
MLTISFILIYLGSVTLGIYLFDYRIDLIINHPVVIIGSLIGGLFVTFVAMILFLEITYYLIARRRPITDPLKQRIGKHIVSIPMHTMRIQTSVYGKEHLPKDPGFLIYANHTSELDISILMWYLKEYPVAFLAKQEVKSYLSIGRWAESVGCVMLNRENARQGSQAIDKVKERVQQGSTMVIFPEGKVSRELGAVQKFRSGAFKVALSAGVPIVPITIVKEPTYYQKRWPRRKKMDIIVHPPIPYEEIKDLSSRQLGQLVKARIEQPFLTKEDLN